MAEEALILAVDSSARADGRLVLAGLSGQVVASRAQLTGITGLVAAVGDLVEVAGGRLSRVVVARGPGSYIGVRSGMALALGVAQGRGLPIHQVGSLEVVAAAVRPVPGDLLVLVAAGRGGIYGQRFRGDVAQPSARRRPVSPSYVLGRGEGWPPDWQGVEWLLPGAGLELELASEARVAGADLSPVEALAELAARDLGPASGYDQLSADYGVRIGEPSSTTPP